MATDTNTQKDNWSSEAYKASASFVPQLTSTVYNYLNPQPGQRILDLGCGDGQLTARIAAAVSPSGGSVLGLDASPAMIAAAQRDHAAPNLSFRIQDCRALRAYVQDPTTTTTGGGGLAGTFDQVFSNAALHWILRGPAGMRIDEVFGGVRAALRPGGRFVFELGGAGNCAEAATALIAGLRAEGGLSAEAAAEASPWHFPSPDLLREELLAAGFAAVDPLEVEYRPTRLTPRNERGTGGLEGWIRLMGAAFLEHVRPERRETVVRYVCEILEPVVRRKDGSEWLNYVRLRGVAWTA